MSFDLLPLTYTGSGGCVQGEQGARSRVSTRNKLPNIVAVVVLVGGKYMVIGHSSVDDP